MITKYHKDPCVVGLTGGIGAGKSTITDYLKEQNIPVFDCDHYVGLLYRDADFLKTLEAKFGKLGEEPKAEMARRVVAEPGLLDQLTPLFDEALTGAITSFINQSATSEMVVIDAPVLFEHGMDSLCHVVLTVSVPESVRRARVIGRKNMTVEKLDLILSKQWTDAQREAKAHFVIHNNGTIAEARESVDGILLAIKKATDVTA